MTLFAGRVNLFRTDFVHTAVMVNIRLQEWYDNAPNAVQEDMATLQAKIQRTKHVPTYVQMERLVFKKVVQI